MKTGSFWLVLALLASGCATELVLDKEGALAVIPLEDRSSKHLLVDTMVNGKGPFRFAVDTAASISVVFESTAKAADVATIAGKRMLLHGMTGSGTYPAALASEVSVGNLSWKPELLAWLPDDLPVSQRMDGLLGIDFLSQYAVAYFADDRILRFYPKQIVEGPGFRGWASVPLYELRIEKGEAAVYVFDLVIAAQRIPAILDIGADASLMNRRATRAIDVPTRGNTRSGMTGATGATIYATELVFWEIMVGNQVWRRRNFLVADFPVFESLGLHRRPAAIAGIDLFRNHDFIVDFAGKRLLVRQAR